MTAFAITAGVLLILVLSFRCRMALVVCQDTVCQDTVCQGAARLKSAEAWAFARLRDDVAAGAVVLIPGSPGGE